MANKPVTKKHSEGSIGRLELVRDSKHSRVYYHIYNDTEYMFLVRYLAIANSYYTWLVDLQHGEAWLDFLEANAVEDGEAEYWRKYPRSCLDSLGCCIWKSPSVIGHTTAALYVNTTEHHGDRACDMITTAAHEATHAVTRMLNRTAIYKDVDKHTDEPVAYAIDFLLQEFIDSMFIYKGVGLKFVTE